MLRSICRTTAVLTAALLITGCGGGEKEKNEGLRIVSRSQETAGQKAGKIVTEKNLVVNPGFEEWEGYKPAGWELKAFSGEGSKLSFYGPSDKAAEGSSSFYIRGLYDTEKWMVLTQTFPIEPGYTVKFSAMMSSDDLKQNKGQDDNAGVYIRFLDKNGERLSTRNFADSWTKRRIGTTPWRRIGETAEVPDGASSMELGLINTMTGYIYFDDVELIVRNKVDWISKDSKFITYNWLPERPFPEEDMKRESDFVQWIAKDIGIKEIEGRINYYLYPDEETFMKLLERARYATAARWDKKELHDIIPFNDHEMIHLILYDMGFPPVGLTKGLVFHYRALYNDWDMDIRCKRFLLQRKIPALFRTIDPDKWRMLDHSVVVPAWASFVNYLIDRYGLDKLKELYAATDGISEEGPFSARFKDIYGEDFQDVDRAWRLHIMRYQGDAAADTLPNN